MTKQYNRKAEKYARKAKHYQNKAQRALFDESWEGGNDGYEYAPGNKKLRRNKIDGMIGGVCAGIGDYFGIDPSLVRIATVLGVIFTGLPLLAYVILWVCIPADKRAPYRREYRQAHKARLENPDAPRRTSSFRDVKSKFRSLESRLQDLERSITSSEWQLRRDFRDLEN